MHGTSPQEPATEPTPEAPSIDGRKLGSLVTILLCGLLAGVVAAAAAFPMVGLSGLSAKAVSDSFQNLPANLRTPQIPQTSKLYDSTGKYMTSFYDENRTTVKGAQIPQIMKDAMVAGEDGRFYKHQGVDPNGILRALVANKQSGEIKQGASTITQQYVKNILKYAAKTKAERDAAEAPTAARKIREIRYAVAVEKELPKEEILVRYLNIAYFGNQAYGVEAAAQAYFSKEVKDLTLGESALLSGLVKSPSQYNPAKHNGEKAKERRNYVLDRMVALEMIDEANAEQAKKEEIVLNTKLEPRKCENAPELEKYGNYCAYFLEWWKNNSAFGKTRQERERNLERGGYRITTAYNPTISNHAQVAVDKQISRNDRYMVGIVVVEPNTGRVLGMANNRTFSIKDNGGGRKYPNSTIPLLTGTTESAGYQSGSTFKMFTAVAALEKGIPLSYKKHAPYQYKSKKFRTGSGGASCSIGRGKWAYCPRNHGKGVSGDYTMWTGFGWSVNTYFVQLEEEVGVPAIADMAEKMGAKMRDPADQAYIQDSREDPTQGGAFTLGVTQVTPLDMASAYATLAARGKYCEPLPLQSITDANGKPLSHANPSCKQVIAPDVADAATDMARCPIGQQSKVGNGLCGPISETTAASVGRVIERPVAGKTGTTDNNSSAWFVGYTPNLAAAAVKVNPDRVEGMTGNQTKQPIEVFKDTMKNSLSEFESVDFVAPTEGRIKGSTVGVPVVDGSDPKKAEEALKNAGLSVRIDPDKVDSNQPEGRVSHTSPAGNEQAPKGSTVTVYVSTGKPPGSTPPSPEPEPAPGGPEPGGGAGSADTPPRSGRSIIRK